MTPAEHYAESETHLALVDQVVHGSTREAYHLALAQVHATLATVPVSEDVGKGVLEQLFAGGPDTSCRTTWHDGVEYVEVPMAELRDAFERQARSGVPSEES